MIELQLDTVEVRVVLDALADYAQRVTDAADDEELGTVPNPTVLFLARTITQTRRAVLDQLPIPFELARPHEQDLVPAEGFRFTRTESALS